MQRRARRGDGSIEGPEQQPRDSLVSAVTIRVVKSVIAPVAAVKHDSIGSQLCQVGQLCTSSTIQIGHTDGLQLDEERNISIKLASISDCEQKKEVALVTQRAGQMYVQALFYIT